MLLASLIGWGFEIVGFVAIAVAVAFFVLRLINRRAGESWWHLAKTKAGQVGDYAASVDPAGQMRQAATEASDDLKLADEALVECAALKRKLDRQISGDTINANRLRAQLKKHLDVEGLADNDPVVVTKAKRLRELEAQIKANTEQRDNNGIVYVNTSKSANSAAKRIQDALQEADRMKVNLNLGEGMVKLQGLLQKYDPSAVNSKMSAIDKYRSIGQDQLDRQQATMQVMADRSKALCPEEEEETEDVSDVLNSIRNGTKTTATAVGS